MFSHTIIKEQDLNDNIKKSVAFTNKKPAYKIQRRFPVEKTFNFKKPVFIGNRAKYAAYALERGKVQVFIQGELGKLIKETMKEGKLFVASRQTKGLSTEGTGGQAYTEF